MSMGLATFATCANLDGRQSIRPVMRRSLVLLLVAACAAVLTGPGARLRGSARDDVLVGGHGHDVAQGRGGSDLCRAEVRRNCER